jgi:hypothetical protein
LPTNLGHGYDPRSITAKVLTALQKMEGASTSTTRHAATQILLRAKYLIVSEEVDADFCFNSELVSVAKRFVMENKIHSGAQPRADIFDKPIENGNEVFDSALQAVQTLSFGSLHDQEIDDIQIANNLAQCANGTMKRSYGYAWQWKLEQNAPKQDHRLSVFSLAISSLCGADTTF